MHPAPVEKITFMIELKQEVKAQSEAGRQKQGQERILFSIVATPITNSYDIGILISSRKKRYFHFA